MNAALTSIGVSASWLLPALLAIPLGGSILVWLLPRSVADPEARLARSVTIALLSLTAVMAVALWIVVPNGTATIDYPWIDEFGSRFRLAANGLSLPMVLLTALLMPLGVIAMDRDAVTHRASSYYALVLVLTGGMLGIFLAADILLFYLFWELMLIPLYFLIGVWGSGRGPAAGMTFVVYTMLGSLLMLVALITVASTAGGTTYSVIVGSAAATPMSMTRQLLCFGAFASAFLVKSALIPFHTWLPDAQAEGPPLAAMALGVKVGTYGMIAVAYPLFPEAALDPTVRLVLASLGVLAIVYGSLVALVQPDFRRVMSYASVAHLGFVVLGISAFTVGSLQGAMLVMVNAGITTGGMFLLLGMLRRRITDDRFHALGGLARRMPHFAAVLVLFALANAGLPGTNGFVGEFLVLLGSFSRFPVLVLIATSGIVLAAAYLLWAVQRTIFGPEAAADVSGASDLSLREAGVMWCFVVAIIGLGLAPSAVLNRTEQSVTAIINSVNVAAERPRVADAAEGRGR